MKDQQGIKPSVGFHNVCDSTKDRVRLKEDRKVGEGFDPAKNYKSKRDAPEKRSYFPEKPISDSNREKHRPGKSNNLNKQD